MGKRYIMVVDERGFLCTETNDKILMIGVVFEYDYCIELKNKECELRKILQGYKKEILNGDNIDIYLDDIMLKENVYKNIDKSQRTNLINELPQLFKSLRFTIISSSNKQDIDEVNDSYSIVTKKLLKKFYSYILKKNGESGGIIIEARGGNANYKIRQNFFDIYNEGNMCLSTSNDIKDKINTFVVCEKNNKTYGAGIEVLNVLTNIFFRVSNGLREVDRKLISNIEYGNKDKIFDVVNHKIYKDTQIYIPKKELQGVRYNNIAIFSNELKSLREQLQSKELRIKEKEMEINELSDSIKFLNQQLEEALLSRKNDGIIFQILSDIDFKMKGVENKAMAAKH